MYNPSSFYEWIAWKLPKNLVHWCAIRLIAYATTGKYSNTVITEIKAVEALRRWRNA